MIQFIKNLFGFKKDLPTNIDPPLSEMERECWLLRVDNVRKGSGDGFNNGATECYSRTVPEEITVLVLQARVALRKEREDWVRNYGSSRLKKALDCGLLGASLHLYYTEVLHKELGSEWRLLEEIDICREISNPSESALDALKLTREKLPKACLAIVCGNEAVTTTFQHRTAFRCV